MIDLIVSRKNKIVLSDYDYHSDIENRRLLASLTEEELEVLQEIVFGSIKNSKEKVARTVALSLKELDPILEKFLKTGLFKLEGDAICVDKELRKYFDFHLERFEEDFIPGMNYIQGLLRKVPIHVLPVWYSIPRTANNILEALLERYFQTPLIYERYLTEIHINEPILSSIVTEVFSSHSFEVSSSHIRQKFSLSEALFDEYMLLLEFNFICCLSFKKEKETWQEVITPFHEWKEWLSFKKKTTPKEIAETKQIEKFSAKPFAFIEDMTYLLEGSLRSPLALLPSASDEDYLFDEETLQVLLQKAPSKSRLEDKVEAQLYFNRVAFQLVQVGLLIRHNDHLTPHSHALEWTKMDKEDKALYLYRHPDNRTLGMGFNPKLDLEKNVREIEKSLEIVENLGWVYFEDYLLSVVVSLAEGEGPQLKKQNGQWIYHRPTYSFEEQKYIKTVILQRLYEVGMIAKGFHKGKECFTLLPFGRETLF